MTTMTNWLQSPGARLSLQNRWLVALLVGTATLAAYGVLPFFYHRLGTPDASYFNLMADAFLHGRLYLTDPPYTEDLTLHQGRWYLAYLPLPALLMTPWAAIGGVGAVKTTLFVMLFGALNASLVFLLLDGLARRGLTKLARIDNLWLTLLFALGSVHWSVAIGGAVWYASQICTVTFVALAAWLAVERAPPWLVGAALALAMAARPHVLLIWPLLLGATMMVADLAPKGEPIRWKRLLAWTIQSAIPVVAMLGLIMLYNHARFGDPLDFGYATMNVGEVFKASLREYGQFNLHYLPKNFWAMWLAGPEWVEARNFWRPNLWGMSLLITTPALVFLVRANRWSWLTAGAWTAFGLIMALLLLYSSTGYGQFGYRYSLDFMIPAMVLLAIGAGSRVPGLMRTLIVAGVLVNLAGVVWWMNGNP